MISADRNQAGACRIRVLGRLTGLKLIVTLGFLYFFL